LADGHSADVDALASAALSALVERRAHGPTVNRSAHLRDLFDASIEPSGSRLPVVAHQMLQTGVLTETVIDVYVPEVARRLGAAWVADRVSFVEVTIGAARLQALARELLDEPQSQLRRRGRVAVIVPRGEDHTLGAVVLGGQLRRLGYAVMLHLGDELDQVVESLRADRPGTVMISASHRGTLPAIAGLVAAARPLIGAGATVAVGGPILGIEDVDVLHSTGADQVACDPVEALGVARSCPGSGASAVRAEGLVR
jgi:methylmalonyl-CoA mutase cobalamin-binding subunit